MFKQASMVSVMATLILASSGCEIEKPIKKPVGATLSPANTKPVLPGLEPAPPTAAGEFKTTKSGVKYQTLKEGVGEPAKAGQNVTIEYTGMLEDGKVFDTTKGKQPASFAIGVGDLIRAWDEAVPGMKPGEKRRLIVPSAAGYGERGTPGGEIPPNATLIFEIDLVEAK